MTRVPKPKRRTPGEKLLDAIYGPEGAPPKPSGLFDLAPPADLIEKLQRARKWPFKIHVGAVSPASTTMEK